MIVVNLSSLIEEFSFWRCMIVRRLLSSSSTSSTLLESFEFSSCCTDNVSFVDFSWISRA